MRRLKLKLGLLIGSLICLPLLVAAPAGALASPLNDVCKTRGAGNTAVCQSNQKSDKNSLSNILHTVINVLLVVAGLVAVLFIIIGGLRYVFSAGDASATKSAKDTIIYAIIGLILAVLAYGIVNFVVSRL
ncbi:MAG TPA: pilin [Candidatus Saccharimonadales bacterium]|nr:pilin [Candidatus Saccharimonadales bacterium]